MKYKMIYEQFDNGSAIRTNYEESENLDDTAIVAPEYDVAKVLGEKLLEHIKAVQDFELCNIVTIDIEINGKGE